MKNCCGILLVLLCIFINPLHAQESIPIYTLDQLQAIGSPAAYILMNDIDASNTVNWNDGKGFKPIGADASMFIGGFDGQGYVIKNLYINRPDEDNVGLFGAVGDLVGCSLTGIWLENASITGKDHVGAIVGLGSYTSMSDCHSSGSVTGRNYVGGLVGEIVNYLSELKSCSSSSAVSGTDNVGGLAGLIIESEITGCFSSGPVNAVRNAGGLIGMFADSSLNMNYSSSPVTGTTNIGGFVGQGAIGNIVILNNCFCTGPVKGADFVGGFIGYNPSIIYINSSYSTSRVEGFGENVGGFAGNTFKEPSFNIDFFYTSCFWDTQASGQPIAGTGLIDGIKGKTTPEMVTKKSFTDAGWDFASVWGIKDGKSYPGLLVLGFYPTPALTTTSTAIASTTTAGPSTTTTSMASSTSTSAGPTTTTTSTDSASTTITPGTTTISDLSTTTSAGSTTTTIIVRSCPATQVLGADNPQLENLRAFRDSKLAHSTLGRKAIEIYYNNADSINAALDRSPILKSFTKKTLEVIAPMLSRKEY